MAPKKPPVDKAKAAAKQKAAEDKTFGLKNKNKSAKVQKFVQNVKQNATQGLPKPVEKKKDKLAADDIGNIFAVTIKQPKVPDGVDPKSIVCEFFRHGQCTKGAKCKFSHDLSVERKGPKISLFTDQRDVGKGGEGGEEAKEGMDDWDQATLEAAVKQKHSNENKPTDITCRFFLDAVERKLYGWFWKCPNGDDCKYRHALPAGYVLKSQMKELLEEEARNAKDITETIEEERAKVVARTPVTEETFRVWHRARREAKAAKRAADEDERRRKGVLNGREIFMQEGFVAADDESAAADYAREADEEGAIADMLARAAAAAAAARDAGAAAPTAEEAEAAAAGAGPSTSGGAGPSTSGGAGPSTHLNLEDEDAGAVFGGDDEDDEEEELEDDEEEDDDDEEGDLDDLAAHVRGTHLGAAAAAGSGGQDG